MSELNLHDLPENWTWTSLENCIDVLDSQRIPINAKEREARKGEIPYYGATGQVGCIDDYIFDEELVLLGEDGAPFLDPIKNKSYIIKGKSWVNNHAHVLRALSGISLNRFISYYLNNFNYNDYVTGTTRLKLNQAPMRKIPFPLAPLPEQHRIVARIEELFSHLDAGVEALRRAKAQLQRYRQAVLKAAVEGRLTEEWRKAHPDVDPAEKLFKRIRSKELNERNPEMEISDLPDLPNKWIWANLGEIGNVSGGLTKNSKRNNYPLKMPYLRVANVYAGELRLDEMKEIGLGENELDRVLLNPGDLLVVEGNGSSDQIGRVALWDGRISPCVHQNHIIKIRFNPTSIGKFVLYWLLSFNGREQINRVASSTSGLYTLSISKVASLLAPLPPFLEQEKIVDEIEYRLSIVDKELNIINKNIFIAYHLRQSILKRAFDGRLVPQDPNDEPVSILLDRIVKSEKRVIPSRRVKRRIKNAMSKEGFKGNDLHKLLLSSNRSLTPRELWKLSNLEIEEFYTLLREEIESGRIIEDKINNKLIAKAEMK